ncbi:hypothetical protein QJS10_CPA02g00882 [Acorus calamus]|uniref:Uncharacterized protein n=1 Tax=Acorus calamus TaxID=4465 RepID=A0AAV9FEE0_ACOCL|nr:hypothetical protein QJS10_CPA02g00882 [Acorus calamus]
MTIQLVTKAAPYDKATQMVFGTLKNAMKEIDDCLKEMHVEDKQCGVVEENPTAHDHAMEEEYVNDRSLHKKIEVTPKCIKQKLKTDSRKRRHLGALDRVVSKVRASKGSRANKSNIKERIILCYWAFGLYSP